MEHSMTAAVVRNDIRRHLLEVDKRFNTQQACTQNEETILLVMSNTGVVLLYNLLSFPKIKKKFRKQFLELTFLLLL